MNCIHQLKGERRLIQAMLEPVGLICQKLSKRRDVNLNHLSKLVEFGKLFVVECHCRKEEQALLPLLEKLGVPIHGAPPEIAGLEQFGYAKHYVCLVVYSVLTFTVNSP